MTVYEMREAISKAYDTRSWKKKVENMYNDQVIAIYKNFEYRGILGKVMKKERPTVCDGCKQLSLFDLIDEINAKDKKKNKRKEIENHAL